MPLTDSIEDLIKEFKKLKIKDWKDDDFSDLTDPCNEEDADTFLEHLKARELFLKNRGKLSQKISVLIATYKKKLSMPPKQQGKGASKSSPTATSTTNTQRGLPPGTLSSTQAGSGSNENSTVAVWFSKAIECLTSAIEKGNYQFQWPKDRPGTITKGFDNLEFIRSTLEKGRKSQISEVANIREKANARKEEHEQNLQLKIIQNEIKEIVSESHNDRSETGPRKSEEDVDIRAMLKLIRTEMSNYSENQALIELWLNHINQYLATTANSPPMFNLNFTKHPSVNMLKQVETALTARIQNMEEKQDELNKQLDHCCFSVNSLIEKNFHGELKAIDTSDLKSVIPQLQSMISELLTRLQKCETALTEERETCKRLSEGNGLLKSKSVDTKSAQNEESYLQKQLHEHRQAFDEINRLLDDDSENESSNGNQRRPMPEKDTTRHSSTQETITSIESKIKSYQQKVCSLLKELAVYKHEVDKIKHIHEDDYRDKARQQKQNEQRTGKDQTLTSGIKETGEVIERRRKGNQETILELKKEIEEYKNAIDNVKHICMGDTGYSTSKGKQTEQLKRKDKPVETSLHDTVEFIQRKINELQANLSEGQGLVQRCIEFFQLIQDICQQQQADQSMHTKRQQKHARRETERDVEKMGAYTVQTVTDLVESISGLMENLKQKNAENMATDNALREANANISSLKTRLSKYMGADLMLGNPNIADLSDTNRPTRLAERYSELYDNEWTNVYMKMFNNEPPNDTYVVQCLLDILKFAFEYCTDTASKQLEQLEFYSSVPTFSQTKEKVAAGKLDAALQLALNDFRKKTFQVAAADLFKHSKEMMKKEKYWDDEYANKECRNYIKSCIEICWLMVIQSPPVHIDFRNPKGNKFDQERFRHYTKKGEKFDFVVWPPLYLTKGGAILCKGVAQGK